MKQSAADLEQRISANLYHVDTIALVEEFVREEARGDLDDADSGALHRYVLRLYHIYPDRADLDTVVRALLLALCKAPSSEFLACSYMVPARFAASEPIVLIRDAARLLESGQFLQFWQLAADHKDLFANVKQFEASIRKFVMSVMAITYQNVSSSDASHLLATSPDQLADLCAQASWTLEGDRVAIPLNAGNQAASSQDVSQRISFDTIRKLQGTY